MKGVTDPGRGRQHAGIQTTGRQALVTGTTPSRNFRRLSAVVDSSTSWSFPVTQVISTAALFATLYGAILLMKFS